MEGKVVVTQDFTIQQAGSDFEAVRPPSYQEKRLNEKENRGRRVGNMGSEVAREEGDRLGPEKKKRFPLTTLYFQEGSVVKEKTRPENSARTKVTTAPNERKEQKGGTNPGGKRRKQTLRVRASGRDSGLHQTERHGKGCRRKGPRWQTTERTT